jgi:hypothetical protein
LSLSPKVNRMNGRREKGREGNTGNWDGEMMMRERRASRSLPLSPIPIPHVQSASTTTPRY